MKSWSLLDFKKSLRTNGAKLRDVRDLPTLRKTFISKAEEAGARRIKFTISTNAVDLDNDTVDQAGWDLSVYRTNPLVLFMHDANQLPVARCVEIGVTGGKLKATAEFVPASVPVAGPFAEAVYQMCRQGFLSATSVGFIPLAFDLAADRMGEDDYLPPVNFRKQKLVEWSVVTVPANSEALIDPAERDGAVAPPAELQGRAMAEAARLAMNRAFDRHKRLARLAELGLTIGGPGSAKSAQPAKRTPAGGLTTRGKAEIRTLQEAMRRGLSNDEIRKLAADGWIKIPKNSGEAIGAAWRGDDVNEARRRGLFS